MDKKHFNFLFTAWRKVQNFDELVINKTSNVEIEKAEQKDENGNVVSLEVQISISTVTECSDENTAPVDAVFIMVPGNWRRIKFKQVFKKNPALLRSLWKRSYLVRIHFFANIPQQYSETPQLAIFGCARDCAGAASKYTMGLVEGSYCFFNRTLQGCTGF